LGGGGGGGTDLNGDAAAVTLVEVEAAMFANHVKVDVLVHLPLLLPPFYKFISTMEVK